MPSGGGGGGKKGGGGSAQAPTLSTPPGLLQSLSNVQGIGQYGQSLFDPLASLGNWAAGIATGGNNLGVQSFSEQGLQTGPQVTIGSGGPVGHDIWSTQFNPQTGQIVFTNAQTGSQFQEWYGSSQAQQWLPQQQLQAWGQLYQNRGQGPVTGGPGTGLGEGSNLNPLNGPGGTPGGVSQSWWNSLGPSLQSAWQQIQSIPGLEQQTQAFTNTATLEGQQLYNQGQGMLGRGAGLLRTGGNMLERATTGTGLYPTQQAYVDQAVQAEQTSLGQQLASEGLGSSTAAQVLKGQAAQQGAATAGQLLQGNIAAAQQEQALGIQEQGAAQQQLNLAQAAQKMALGGQALSLGEAQAMAGLSQAFQAQTWGEAVQAYQTLGQMMSTTGALYGIDVTGYSNILQENIAQGQLSLEAALGNAQAAIGGMQSLGSGLGSILGSQGLSGLLSGGGLGAGGAGAATNFLPEVSTGLAGFDSIGGAAGGIAGGAAGGGGLLSGIGGAFSGLFSGIGSAGSGILSALGGLLAFL